MQYKEFLVNKKCETYYNVAPLQVAPWAYPIEETQFNDNYFKYLAQELHRFPECAQRYAQENITEREHAAIETVLAALQRCSEHDGGSSDLLCFGYHILAQRRNAAS